MPKFGAQIDAMGIPVKSLVPEQGTAFPGSPVEGQLFHRTDTKTFWMYLNATWIQCDNNGVAAAVHIHAIADVTGLTAALAGKAPTVHTHVKADITDLVSASDTVQGIVELATTAEATTGTDTVRAVTPAGVKAVINALVGTAPGLLDTLGELSDALGDDPNFATTMTTALAGKAPLVHTHDGNDVTLNAGAVLLEDAMEVRTVYMDFFSPILVANTWALITPLSAFVDGATRTLLNVRSVSFTIAGTNEVIELDWKFTAPSSLSIMAAAAQAANYYRIYAIGTVAVAT